MKSLLLAFLLTTSTGTLLTPALLSAEEVATKRTCSLTNNDNNGNSKQQQEVALGEILEVQLDNNGSIGTSWHFSNFSQEGLLYLGSPVDGSIQDPEVKYPLGAPHPYVWRFIPNAVGSTDLIFAQTDRNGIISNYTTFTVIVTPAKL